VLKTTKTEYLVGVVLLIWLIAGTPPVYSEEGVRNKLFLKTGRVIECDEVWIESKDIVRCRKTSGMLLYPIDDVDLKKPFGEAFGEPPITRVEEKKPPATLARVEVQREQYLKIGPAFSSFNYEEPGVMELDGTMYGIMGTYMHPIEDGLGFTLSLRYVFGSDMDYTGATWGGTPVTTKADDYVVELRGLLSSRNLFAGIGYRYWNDKAKGTGAYEREILYWYAPFGIEVSGPLSENWVGRVKGEYDFFISGTVKSHLSDVAAGANDPENDQDTGYGFRFSLEFKRQLRNLYALSIEPFFIYWDIDESDWALLTLYGVPVTYVYEPENETRNYGVLFNLYF
jgi:hypothetical protein